jgi:hypothetical protein
MSRRCPRRQYNTNNCTVIRGTFNIATGLSLVLCCTLVAAWLWGRHTPRAFEIGHKGQLWRIATDAGHLRIDNEPQRLLDRRPLCWAQQRCDSLFESWRSLLFLPDHAAKELGSQAINAQVLRDRLCALAPAPSDGRFFSIGVLAALASVPTATRLIARLTTATRRGWHKRRFNRMHVSLFGSAALFSTGLFCGVTAVWMSHGAVFEFSYRGTLWRLFSDAGHLRIDTEAQRRVEQQPARWLQQRSQSLADRREEAVRRFVAYGGNDPDLWFRRVGELERRIWQVSELRRRMPKEAATPLVAGWVRLTPLFAASAAVPLCWVIGLGIGISRGKARRKAGLCHCCGYDLRATPGLCPECGTPGPLRGADGNNRSAEADPTD